MRARPRSSLWVRLFAAVGIITTAAGLLLLIGVAVRCAVKGGVRKTTIVEVDLTQPFATADDRDPVRQLLEPEGFTLRSLVETLDRATADERVVGLFADLGAADHGFAATQELHDAIERFRASGKFAVAYSTSFGEFGGGNESYVLASAFDEIWLQPTGSVGLTGLRADVFFVKGALDTIGVEIEFGRRSGYKTALNSFTERRFTPEHRESLTSMLQDLFDQLVASVAAGRKKSEAEVRQWIDEGPLLAPEALAKGVVDGLGYRDEVLSKVKERSAGGASLLFASRYRERAAKPSSTPHKVGLIEIVGQITAGEGWSDPIGGVSTAGADTVSAAFQMALADDSIEAILLYVDSPGGSAVASDTIWRQTVRARDAGKPVVVCMGNVAASGGYYVAAGATKIVAQPGTITGSIGVFAGKPYAREMWNDLGVTWDSVSIGKNAGMFSSIERFDAGGRERLELFLEQVYRDFKGKVVQGRGLSEAQVEALAQGRVWTGAQAKAHGLVDALGGLRTGIELVAAELGVAADELTVMELPPDRDIITQWLAGDERDNSEDGPTIRSGLHGARQHWDSALEALQGGPEQFLLMPAVDIAP